jgi:hypothetical protein
MGGQIALGGIPPEEYRSCITQIYSVKFMGLLQIGGQPKKFLRNFSDFFSEIY